MKNPLVSVICLSHNHASYIADAVASVIAQTYSSVELILVDDGSTDQSKSIIRDIIKRHPDIHYIDIAESIGNCAAFNKGLAHAQGTYLIDLAADDMLLPNRIEKGVETFRRYSCGVEFCNVRHVNEGGHRLKSHFAIGSTGKSIQQVPSGDLYELLIRKYVISAPGMMIHKQVFEKLKGYDDTLQYEDFDFWIRSSREFLYHFTDDVLVEKRDVSSSLSKRQFRMRNKFQTSTLRVCQKIYLLNRRKTEDKALRDRLTYEIKQCLRQLNWELIPSFIYLYLKTLR